MYVHNETAQSETKLSDTTFKMKLILLTDRETLVGVKGGKVS